MQHVSPAAVEAFAAPLRARKSAVPKAPAWWGDYRLPKGAKGREVDLSHVGEVTFVDGVTVTGTLSALPGKPRRVASLVRYAVNVWRKRHGNAHAWNLGAVPYLAGVRNVTAGVSYDADLCSDLSEDVRAAQPIPAHLAPVLVSSVDVARLSRELIRRQAGHAAALVRVTPEAMRAEREAEDAARREGRRYEREPSTCHTQWAASVAACRAELAKAEDALHNRAGVLWAGYVVDAAGLVWPAGSKQARRAAPVATEADPAPTAPVTSPDQPAPAKRPRKPRGRKVTESIEAAPCVVASEPEPGPSVAEPVQAQPAPEAPKVAAAPRARPVRPRRPRPNVRPCARLHALGLLATLRTMRQADPTRSALPAARELVSRSRAAGAVPLPDAGRPYLSGPEAPSPVVASPKAPPSPVVASRDAPSWPKFLAGRFGPDWVIVRRRTRRMRERNPERRYILPREYAEAEAAYREAYGRDPWRPSPAPTPRAAEASPVVASMPAAFTSAAAWQGAIGRAPVTLHAPV